MQMLILKYQVLQYVNGCLMINKVDVLEQFQIKYSICIGSNRIVYLRGVENENLKDILSLLNKVLVKHSKWSTVEEISDYRNTVLGNLVSCDRVIYPFN